MKYKTMRTTAGQANMRAAQDLHDMLAELEADDRRAAEAAAPAMFEAYLADDSRKILLAKHPWPWFVTGFDALRADHAVTAAAPAPDPERDYRPPKLVFTPRPRNITPDDGADPPAPALARR